MLDVVEFQVDLIGMGVGAAELAAIVCQQRRYGDPPLPVEREGVIMQNRHGGLRLLRRVQEAKRIAAISVHHGMQIDLAHALEMAHVEGILGEQLPWSAALYMPFPEAGVGFLDLGDLLRGEFDRLFGRLLFQFEQALILLAHSVLDQDVLDGGGADGNALQFELVAQTHTPPTGVRQAHGQDVLHGLRRGGERVAVVDGR